MSDAKVGITIMVNGADAPKAVKLLRDIDGGASKAGKSADGLSKRMRDVAKSVIFVNQAVDLATRLFRGFSAVVQRTFGESLRHRFLDDSIVQSVKRINQAFNRVNNAAVDSLAPLFVGIARVLTPLSKKIEDFLKANEELTRTKVIEWAVKLGVALVTGVAAGAKAAALAWAGFRFIVAGTESIVNKTFNFILSGISHVFEGIYNLTKGKPLLQKALFGDERGGVEFLRASIGLQELANEFRSSGDAADKEFTVINREFREFDKNVDAVSKGFVAGIKKAGVEAMKALGVSTHASAQAMEELAQANERVIKKLRLQEEAARKLFAARIAQTESAFTLEQHREDVQSRLFEHEIDRLFARARTEQEVIHALSQAWVEFYANRDRISIEAERRTAERLADTQYKITQDTQQRLENHLSTGASILRTSFEDSFRDIGKTIDGHTKTWGDAFRQFFGSLGQKALEALADTAIAEAIKEIAREAIAAHAAAAAAGAAESQSAIPIIGPALAIAAAAAMFIAISAYAGKFHTGGIVPGRSGQERFALLKAKELVVPEEKVPAAIALGLAPGGVPARPSRGGPRTRTVASALAGGGGGNTYLTIQTLAPPTSRGELRRSIKGVVQPEINELRRNRATREGPGW